MNWIGSGALVIFVVAWAGGIISWFAAAYHLVSSSAGFAQPRPSKSLLRQNLSWFRHGIAGLRTARNSTPAPAANHRQKALKAGAMFLCFIAMAMLAGLVGSMWGGWGAIEPD